MTRSSAEDPDARPDGSARSPSPDQVIVRELERRLGILEGADDAAFGRFTALDWTLCVLAFAVLPLLLVWWAA